MLDMLDVNRQKINSKVFHAWLKSGSTNYNIKIETQLLSNTLLDEKLVMRKKGPDTAKTNNNLYDVMKIKYRL